MSSRRRKKRRKRAAAVRSSSARVPFCQMEPDEEFLTVSEFRDVADELFRRFGVELPADSDSFRWRFDDTPFCPVLIGVNYDTQEIRFHGPEPAVEYARQVLSEVFGDIVPKLD